MGDKVKGLISLLMRYDAAYKESILLLSSSESLFREECEKGKSSAVEMVEDFGRKSKKVVAYLQMALPYTNERGEVTEGSTFDLKTLGRLALQIDKSSRSDPFAKELYREAKKQLLQLEKDLDSTLNDSEKYAGALRAKYSQERQRIQNRQAEIESGFREILNSQVFSLFEQQCITLRDKAVIESEHENRLLVGYHHIPMSFAPELKKHLVAKNTGTYSDSSFIVPAVTSISPGSIIYAEYDDSSESLLLDGLHALLMNAIRLYANKIECIDYIDPLRLDSSALSELAPIVDFEDSIIRAVPNSPAAIRERLQNLLIKYAESTGTAGNNAVPRGILFLHAFPANYDSQMLAAIRQLALNAAHYGLCLIVSQNISQRSSFSDDVISQIKLRATDCITFNNRFAKNCVDTNTSQEFTWLTMPQTLPSEIYASVSKRTSTNKNNDYISRVGLNIVPFRKGNRAIKNIPYGIDNKGDILYLDFEDSNFATFICGAARSGKSTLLHTILTGLLKNHHPDDIEIWLVDFKMTEFSRYVKHTPPHVRYIMLDESPEMVYDLLDRLSDILTKRQNIFKGKWQKLDEVPRDKYMPAMFVIIDEFSVMSQIVADSALSGREDYRVKLQFLLSKGAALGMHFIFASQGFTSGTRGLNDFSKKQVQQRIAMKTEYNEIKETLDLKSLSETDRMLMEQLPAHHALVRVPADKNGNHIIKTKVLYISDYNQQERMIDSMCSSIKPKNRYCIDDARCYVDKQVLIKDGSVFHSFEECRDEIERDLQNQDLIDESVFAYLGEPRRMMRIFPIEMSQSFCENILVMASGNEKMPATSIVLSLRRSMQMQQRDISVWADNKDSVYRTLISACRQKELKATCDLDDVCSRIHSLKQRVENGIKTDACIVLLGIDRLLQEMSYLNRLSESRTTTTVSIEKREPGELGLLAQLDLITKDGADMLSTGARVVTNARTDESRTELIKAYDAREDLKYILTRGSKYGLHFVVVLKNLAEFNLTKLDASLFRHKVMFAMPKGDAMSLIGSYGASIVAELSDHSFRYTNGLDNVTFRPYLHFGLAWDGWQVGADGAVDKGGVEEDLLL